MKIKHYLKHLVVTVSLLFLFLIPSFGASIGDTLAEPESGWQRHYFEKTNYFRFDDGIKFTGTDPEILYSTNENQLIKFKFRGTSLRLIAMPGDNRSKNMTISIDGKVETLPALYSPSKPRWNKLIYNRTGLTDEIHEVVITSGSDSPHTLYLHSFDINEGGNLIPFEDIVLDIVPDQEKIQINNIINTSLTINNITNIAAEDIIIEYDAAKLEFKGFENIEGFKLIHSAVNESSGEIRLIMASEGEANIVNTKEVLLKLQFEGITKGKALINITKAKVADGIELEKELLLEECGQTTIEIIPATDVNNSGGYTLLDLSIDARHFGKDPTDESLSQYNTDVVLNGSIDDQDLLEIAKGMLSNSTYVFNN